VVNAFYICYIVMEMDISPLEEKGVGLLSFALSECGIPHKKEILSHRFQTNLYSEKCSHDFLL
jgi:hypothetical protein